MFFKLSILLLSFIIAANSVLNDENEAIDEATASIANQHLTDPDEIFEDKYVILEEDPEVEILRDSYDDCKRWWGKPQASTVGKDEFWMYMGKNKSDYFRIEDYNLRNPEGPIDFIRYGKLFKTICSKRGVAVKDWAAYRKGIAATRTSRQTSLLPWGDYD